MFTGIVSETGAVQALITRKNLITLTVKAEKAAKGVKLGDSIAINGVCLTVAKIKGKSLSFDMMKETLLTTTLGKLKENSKVNLEPALKLSDRIGGHFVTGHVDSVSRIDKIIEGENYTEIVISLQSPLRKFIAPKGSVCIDGVSLTVGAVKKNSFSVYLIPFTKEVTTFGIYKKGSCVNIEVDILARYTLNQRGV